MRIEDAVVWRKALSERPDEFATVLIDALRRIAALQIMRVKKDQPANPAPDLERNVAQFIAQEALIAAGLDPAGELPDHLKSRSRIVDRERDAI